ncbi:MAG: HU family DNA-binding protein [Kistimonas sp.]|nr:HU family DNA-binding protein [Kistimonas sp.]
MKSLTRADIVAALADDLRQSGFNKEEAASLLECFLDELRCSLERNEPVKLSRFGRFGLRDKEKRPGRNPVTGHPAPVAPRRVVTFKACCDLKEKVVSNVHSSSSS